MESMAEVRRKLQEQGVNAQIADACSQLFHSVPEVRCVYAMTVHGL